MPCRQAPDFELDVAIAAGLDTAVSMAAERAAAAVCLLICVSIPSQLAIWCWTRDWLLHACRHDCSDYMQLWPRAFSSRQLERTVADMHHKRKLLSNTGRLVACQVVAAALAQGSTDNVTAVVGAVRWE